MLAVSESTPGPIGVNMATFAGMNAAGVRGTVSFVAAVVLADSQSVKHTELYRLNDRWTYNAAWVFNSGQAFTAPSGKYQVIDNWIYYYAERNGYRAPDYHHLDVSAVYKRGTRKEERGRRRVETEWVFGIYNIYNRYNPYLINFEDSENGARTKAKQYSLFGIVPSVAFNVTF